jgi:hypothetical protein
MRTAMVTRGRAWGCVIFHRTAASGDFTQEDAALMGKLSRPIAEALRNTLRFDAARRARPRAPSLLVLGPTDDVELAIPGTDEVLELLRYADPVARTLPAPVLILAAQVRAGTKGGRPPEPLHIATAEGWITLHGSLPSGPKGRVAIVFQTTPEAQAAPLRLETFGLSAREGAKWRHSSRAGLTPQRSPKPCSFLPGRCRITVKRFSRKLALIIGASFGRWYSSTTICPQLSSGPRSTRSAILRTSASIEALL